LARFTREDGFSLPELLIVTAIVGMVAAAIFGVYQVSQQIYIRSTSLEDAQLGARSGLDLMATELRLAGAYLSSALGAPAAIDAATADSITFRGDVNADTLNSSFAEIELTAATGPSSTAINIPVTSLPAPNPFAANKYIHIQDGAKREVRQIKTTYNPTDSPQSLPVDKLTFSYSGSGSASDVRAKVRTIETVTYALTAYVSCPTPLPSIAGTSCLTRSVDGGTAETIVENVTGLTLTYYDANGADLGGTPTLASIREIEINLTTQGSDGSRRTMTSRVRPRNLGAVQE